MTATVRVCGKPAGEGLCCRRLNGHVGPCETRTVIGMAVTGRNKSPSGRVHVQAGDRVRHVSGLCGTVRLLAADLGVATVELDDGTRRSFELNTLTFVPRETP